MFAINNGRIGETRCTKTLCYCTNIWRSIMHNLISFNQLAGSKQEHTFDPHQDLIAEYYECLIDCEDDQHVCKRICKEVLI